MKGLYIDTTTCYSKNIVFGLHQQDCNVLVVQWVDVSLTVGDEIFDETAGVAMTNCDQFF